MPDAPKQPAIKEVYHDSALVSWEPPADGGKPITGYIVERKETMANRWDSQIRLADLDLKLKKSEYMTRTEVSLSSKQVKLLDLA